MISKQEKLHAAFAALIATLTLAAAPALNAQQSSALSPNATILGAPDDNGGDEGDHILGKVEGDQYVAPSGAFRVTIPILPELGGQINDTQNVVTFQDAYGEHVSIGCFPINDNLRTEESKRGRKDFLVWFFQNFIQSDFARSIPGTSVEPNARFINNNQGGILFTQLLLPDGSVFAERVFVFPPKPEHVAKRGNFVFVNNNNVYVLSTELSERIFEFSTYKKTATEEEDMLRARLNELLSHITFANRPATAPSPTSGTSETVPSISFPSSSTKSGTNRN